MPELFFSLHDSNDGQSFFRDLTHNYFNVVAWKSWKGKRILIITEIFRINLLTTTTKLLQSCPTLCDPMDYSPPGSSVHGIFQARVLELGAET